MTTISRRELLTICTVAGGLTLASWELFDLSVPTLSQPTTSSQPSPAASTTPSAMPTEPPTETPTTMSTETPTATPTQTPTTVSTDTPTRTPTATPTQTPTATPVSLSSSIQFTPVQTFTSDEYGYQIAVPVPWVVKNDESGNDIKVATANDLAFLKVVVSQDRGRPLTTVLPGVVGITDHDLTQLTREGHPALRFERSYRATTNGPQYRVEGLITRVAGHTYVAQCGVIIQSSETSNDTSSEAVAWTPTIEQATTRIIESFTIGSRMNNQ